MLDLLEAFATVVEHTSLNQAAKRLNISQPALSRQVSRLEEELNVELFARHGKRLELTRVGQMTYDFALDIRSRQLSFMKSITAYKTEGQTNVTIGASLTTLQTTLPLFVSMFKEQYPDAQLKAVTGKTHEIVSYVRNKKVDFGIVGDAIREQGLVSIPLLSDHLMLVLPSSHELTRVKDWTMSHLNGVPMLLFSNGTWYRKLIDDLFRRYRIMPDIRMEIDSFEAIGRLLATCEATALLPKSYLRPEWLLDNRLIAVHLKELEQTERVTSLVYAEQAMLTESVRKFIAEAVIRSEWLGN
ncbi:LysR family transcriptional regulator [Paenibacillus sp. UMB4589-SE434]|uniref:LysR family transcriptional regulator n=1 Tax=Paenibacillus sp. UMB4589-SE434 TaxID=3046314 RepID=UPI00254D4F0A|nr:LysR family transcriptional regulator [Paenibacillus sp. UMB4589-SE434]MDK8183958.1 LysR family transcriptional regulator [Paenibacillus sp. UMB4589-SE434]